MLASGFSPPLQISHNVVPKLHLSEARLRFLGSKTHSGDTQGIRSRRTTKMFKINLKLDANILIKRDNPLPITSDHINSPIWHRLILLNKVHLI